MFIIIEGPDGAGKSTLVQEVVMELWRQDRGTVLINQKRSPRQGVIVEYCRNLNFYLPGHGIDLILDRCWYSDDVYGPIWRNAGLPAGVCEQIEDWAERRGAQVARLDQPDDVLEKRLAFRGDLDVAPKDAAMYAALYRQQSQSWLLPTLVNPTAFDLIEAARNREEKAEYDIASLRQSRPS